MAHDENSCPCFSDVLLAIGKLNNLIDSVGFLNSNKFPWLKIIRRGSERGIPN
ncbi:hypothetical protein HAPAU_37290 [Halalkalicoccus paucihalophilus]|uniref:Uncharacterized protein n=1 Tax=Halalkalicoccus paucihalophilus TaxID=1008153 RepID=A0A151A976_9EURY|nr:hypothetical protein HAPAU_37290 [Halalkalicoccus paucihalophilus]